jgi:nickel/cobalt exporter
MRARLLLAAALAVALLAVAAPGAMAHPLGNFSINHLSTVSISADRVDVRYILDQAEIPTVQERGLSRDQVLERKLAEIEDGLALTVDGRPAELRRARDDTARAAPEGGGRRAAARVARGLDVPGSGRLEGDRRRAR